MTAKEFIVRYPCRNRGAQKKKLLSWNAPHRSPGGVSIASRRCCYLRFLTHECPAWTCPASVTSVGTTSACPPTRSPHPKFGPSIFRATPKIYRWTGVPRQCAPRHVSHKWKIFHGDVPSARDFDQSAGTMQCAWFLQEHLMQKVQIEPSLKFGQHELPLELITAD